MKAIFEAINNIFSFVTPVSDFLWDFPKNFEVEFKRVLDKFDAFIEPIELYIEERGK